MYERTKLNNEKKAISGEKFALTKDHTALQDEYTTLTELVNSTRSTLDQSINERNVLIQSNTHYHTLNEELKMSI